MMKNIQAKTDDGIALLSINRPDQLNALNNKTIEELHLILNDFNNDKEIKVVIITGSGNRAFVAGADIKEFASYSKKEGEKLARNGQKKLFDFIENYSKPIIAAINGPAAGVGFIMALFADIRFAKESAVFSSAFSKRGLIAEWGVGWILPRLVGIARANDILFSSRKFTAEEAEQMGIVNKMFSEDEFDTEVFNYAADLAKNVSPRSLRIMKQQIYNAQGESIKENLDSSMQAMLDSFKSEDFKEGVSHFVEKREAKFTGK